MATDDDIRLTILRKMLRLEFIGGRHTSIENLPRGFPPHEKGRVVKVARMMVKQGYFIVKQKPDGIHVSLNPRILQEVKKQIGSDW